MTNQSANFQINLIFVLFSKRLYSVKSLFLIFIFHFLFYSVRNEFIGLPIQAVRCRLAFLKPPNNVSTHEIISYQGKKLKGR